MIRYLLLTCCLLFLSAAYCQEEKLEDISEQTSATDESKRSFINDNAPVNRLIKGGAFYVSTPPPLMELDPKKAYYRTEWDSLVLRLVTGGTVELEGRYRLLDQKFEIKTDDGIYEIYNTMVAEAQLGDDYFAVFRDKLGMKIFQVYYRSTNHSLIGHHSSEWQDPPNKNMFDTREAKRTLKKKQQLFIAFEGGTKEAIRNRGQLMDLLGINKKSPAGKFVKQEKIDSDNPADVVRLLQFVDQSSAN
ncbi:hypothetical protein [Neolewinella persica]|uniref:hypothetical protein n=1 Tax=Neolewinella persica TaxID=70998 RepID=UPI00036CCFC9|nr:hypothetical protein [Neolewinella persica]